MSFGEAKQTLKTLQARQKKMIWMQSKTAEPS